MRPEGRDRQLDPTGGKRPGRVLHTIESHLARPTVARAVGQRAAPCRHWSACWAAWDARATHASAAARFAVAAATTWEARASSALTMRV